VDTQTRQVLKEQDPLVHATASSAEWLQNNRQTAIQWGLGIVALIAVIVAVVLVYNQRSNAAQTAFGAAMNLYATPIDNPAQPAPPGTKTFKSIADRSKAANPLFVDVANHYAFTGAAHDALYFAGLTYADMGDNANAQTYLEKAISAGNANTSSLAKLALANLDTETGRNADAIKLLQQLIDKPTVAVPAATAQLDLAALYQTSDPAKAKQIYTTLKDKDKTTAAGQIAAQKLAGK